MDDPPNRTPRYLPSLAEIAAATAEIRSHWTEADHRSRWAGPTTQRWLPPGANRGDCVLAKVEKEPTAN